MKSSNNYWRPFLRFIGRNKGERTYLIRISLTPFKWWKWDRWYIHIFGCLGKRMKIGAAEKLLNVRIFSLALT